MAVVDESTVSEVLLRFCKQHGINTISVMAQAEFSRFTVFLHWDEQGEDRCVSGSGETFQSSLDAAWAAMRAERAAQVEA